MGSEGRERLVIEVNGEEVVMCPGSYCSQF